MKYIHVDPESLADWTEIMLEYTMALNPHVDEETALELMREFLALNKLSANAASVLGSLIKATENTWMSRETH